MAEKNRGQVAIRFTDGTEIHTFISFAMADKYTDPLGNYSFTIQPPRDQISQMDQRLQKGELISVTINEVPQGAFLIQTKATTISKDVGVQFQLTCNTVLVTPHEGSVDPDISESFQADTPVSDVILTAMEPYGFDLIIADASANVQALTGKAITGRAANPVPSEIKHKEAKANEGESAYAFCARIFSRLGLALRVDWAGTLLLGSPDYDQAALYRIEQPPSSSDADAIMGDVEINDSNANQFTEVVIRGAEKDEKGQKRAGRPTHRLRVSGFADPPVTPAFTDVPTTTVAPGRHSYKSAAGAIFKPAYKLDKFSRDKDFCEQRCHRWLGRRNESGYVVTATVDGLISATGAIWTVDTICRVKIDAIGLDEDMWILATEKAMSKSGAQMTKLTLIPKHSLILGVG